MWTVRSAADRFIPSRRKLDIETTHFNILDTLPTVSKLEFDPVKTFDSFLNDDYERYLGAFAHLRDRILTFSTDELRCRPLISGNSTMAAQNIDHRKRTRHLSLSAEKILNLPNIRDDFYSNILDWSSQDEIVVALNTDVFSWNSLTNVCSAIPVLLPSDSDMLFAVTALAWQPASKYLAIGSQLGGIRLWDCETKKLMLLNFDALCPHSAAVYAITWSSDYSLISASECGCVLQCDISTFAIHSFHINPRLRPVCAVAVSACSQYLAAAGANGIVCICSLVHHDIFRTIYAHTDTIKALCWCPWQAKLLATGGGCTDGYIRVWNANSGNMTAEVDTKSQVCCLIWASKYNELISGHGVSFSDIIIWKYPGLVPIVRLRGHQHRVLGLALSTDGNTLASCAADELLMLWNCFETYSARPKRKDTESSQNSLNIITSVR